MLKTYALHKSFGGFVAIRELNFEIAAKEIHAVIGPNGAGKTTMFNLVTGHLEPDHGYTEFEGRRITGLPPHGIVRLGIARSFQLVNIFPRMSVFENVQVALIAHNHQHLNIIRQANGISREETEEMLELVGLRGEADIVAGELAHGKQKQLELAVALAADPRLLLLDEPTAGMSPHETVEAMHLIQRIIDARGVTLLFTEHDMNVVFGIATRISVLHHGEIIASGAPDEVRSDKEVQSVYLGGTANVAAGR